MTEQVLEALRRRTNHRGLVIANESTLLEELRITSEVLRATVKRLEEASLVEVLSPLPFLILKWSGKESPSAENGRNHGPSASSRHSYSFNNQSIDESIAFKAIAGAGHSTEADALLGEILSTLGETDPTTFHGMLMHYPATSIRAVLDRVRATPPEKLRKSKTALFRYLLARTKHSPTNS